MILRFLIINVFLFWIIGLVSGQQESKDIKISGNYQDVPVEQFLKDLERNYNIRSFYKHEWLDSVYIDAHLDHIPLYLALNKVLDQGSISFRFFQNSIVLFPKSVTGEFVMPDNSQSVMTIGNFINRGRFPRATLKGIITDGKNGERLIGAIVQVPDLNAAGTSNAQGEFVLELPTGRHKLKLSYIGFEPQFLEIDLIENGDVLLELFEDTHNLNEITVKGERNSCSKTQMSMTRVNPKTIKELPVLMGEADVIKSVVMMPGVQSTGELSSGINVRGGNSDQNLVLLNGAPIFNTSHLFGFFSTLNPDGISDVVLYKGGLPASFGNRVASVMDIKMKEGNKEHLQLYGGIGLINSRLTIEGPFVKNKKSSFLIGGRSTYSDWILRQMRNVKFRNSIAHFYDLNGLVNLQISDRNNLNLMAYTSSDEFNLNSNSLYQYENLIGSLNWKMTMGSKIISDLNTSYSKYDFTLNAYSDVSSLLDYKLNSGIEYIGLKYNLTYLASTRLKLNAGIQVNRQQINPGQVSPIVKDSEIQSEKIIDEQALGTAAYSGLEFDLGNRLTISAGLRYSRSATLGEDSVYLYDTNRSRSKGTVVDTLVFGKNENVKNWEGFEPRFSLKYTLSESSSFRLAYQRVNQYMNQISNASIVSPADFWKICDYHIAPLKSDQFAIGYFKKNNQKGIETSIEGYYKYLQNLIEYKNGAKLVMNHHLETDIMQADGYAYGVELLVKRTIGRLNGWLSYTYSRTMRQTNNSFDEEIINNGRYYPSVYDRPHDLSIVANYNISRRWRLSGNFVLSSGRPTTLTEQRYIYNNEQVVFYSDRNKYRMPTYHRFDISITFDENLKRKRNWKGSWTFSVYNLYARKNPYSIYYQKKNEDFKQGSYGLYQLSIIGIPVPSLTYNFRF